MVALEKAGLPTVALTAKHFTNDAKATGKMLGLPELPLAIVPTTITNRTAEWLREMVAAAIDQVEEGLTRQPDSAGAGADQGARLETVNGDDLLDCQDRLNDLFVEREWSDGLPLIPPTPQAVVRMLSGTRLSPDRVVVRAFQPGNGIATVEKIAINGVMAGCKPEQMPVLIAMVKAYEATGANGKTQAMSTGPNAPLVMVSGPIVQKLGFNYSTCVLGPGSPSRVNTVIGRALRLILMNVGFCYPGSMDMDTLGTPCKYSFCVAENADRSPWVPWSVEKGFDKDTSTVSIALVYPGPDIYNHTAKEPEELLETLGTLTGSYIGMASVGRWLYGGRKDPVTWKNLPEQNVMLLAPTHADIFKRAGWSRSDISEYLYTRSRIPFGKLYSNVVNQAETLKKTRPELAWLLEQPETKVAIAESPECFQVFVSGGEVGRSQFHWGASEVTTVAIEE